MAEASGFLTAPLPRLRPQRPKAILEGFVAAKDQIAHDKAFDEFELAGDGITVAVIDTGCRADHDGFDIVNGSRIETGRRFFQGGSDEATNDENGHGTAVSGVIASALDGVEGIAPEAKIIPLKVAGPDGRADFAFIAEALRWVRDEGIDRGVSVVNLSLGNEENFRDISQVDTDGIPAMGDIAELIATLHGSDVPVVTASGNAFFMRGFVPGMSFPAITPESISVGAVHTEDQEDDVTFTEYGGARIVRAAVDLMAPFSQRLPKTDENTAFTTLVAPGAPIDALGHESDVAVGEFSGTSLAAPIVSGVIALIQQKFQQDHGAMPTCSEIVKWLRDGSDSICDKHGDHDNVDNTGKSFPRVNVFGALEAMNPRAV